MGNSSQPPDSIDIGWEDEPESSGEERRPERKEKSEVRPATDLRATMPPPMPAADYVEEMMRVAPESESVKRFGRHALDTVHEEDPLRWDAPGNANRAAVPVDQKTPLAQRHIDIGDLLQDDGDAPRRASQEGPQIETAEEYLEDDDPQIARNTPPVPPPLTLDDLDDLAVDDVLRAVSERPARASASEAVPKMTAPPPTVTRPQQDLVREELHAAGLRLKRSTSDFEETTDGLPEEDQDFRATMPGEPPPDMLAAAAAKRAQEGKETPKAMAAVRLRADAGPELDLHLGGAMDHEPQANTTRGAQKRDPFEEVVDLFEAGSYNTALDMAEAILADDPSHEGAKKCVASCQELLLEVYLNKLGDRSWVLRVTCDPNDVIGLGLDHRAGFLLSFIDGAMSIDEVLDVASMPAFDAARMLCDLKSRGVIIAEPPGGRR